MSAPQTRCLFSMLLPLFAAVLKTVSGSLFWVKLPAGGNNVVMLRQSQ